MLEKSEREEDDGRLPKKRKIMIAKIIGMCCVKLDHKLKRAIKNSESVF